MVLLSALAHLLLALADLPGVSPVALLAAAGAVLGVALLRVRPRPGEVEIDDASIPEPPDYRPIPVRCADPNAPGRSRPRAPSAATAAA
jgi:hypothetical protein